jgi:hypothetical protein
MRRPGSLLAALALVALPFVSAAQAQVQGASIRLEPSKVELVGDTGPQVVRVTVEGSVAGTVVLSFRDAVVGADGVGTEAPFGTTADSLSGTVELLPPTFDSVPDVEPVAFTGSVALAAGPVDRPRFGTLVAELTTPDGAVAASARIPVLAVPGARAIETLPEGTFAVTVDDLDLAPQAFTFVDELLPDIPGVIGHGPLTTIVTTRNAGTAVVETRVAWEYHRLGLADLFSPESRPTLSTGTGSRFLIPGEVGTAQGQSNLTLDAGPFDAVPLVGFVRVRATVAWDLAGVAGGAETTVSRTMLVFPWSEFVVGLVVWSAWRRRFGKVVDLRYSNAPIPIEPGTHRQVGWWRRVGEEAFDRIVGTGRGKRRKRV